MISTELENHILKITKAESIVKQTVIQKLWSGYGNILRIELLDGLYKSIIVKVISFPKQNMHPRGWNTSVSHARKVKSYEVEKAWYLDFNNNLNRQCKTAKCLNVISIDNEDIIILEDLNEKGFPKRKEYLSIEEVKPVLSWLANFHVININKQPSDLWEYGTYWHFSTRKYEFNKMDNSVLKENADKIDYALNNCKYKTIIHGDAKVANFCFSINMKKVAAVDFQYVGVGCGIKDIIYLFSSCLTSDECQEYEIELLYYYFKELNKTITNKEVKIEELEKEWRGLYSIAWADFIRFLQGWSPNHYKLNSYSLSQVNKALDSLTRK